MTTHLDKILAPIKERIEKHNMAHAKSPNLVDLARLVRIVELQCEVIAQLKGGYGGCETVAALEALRAELSRE